MKKVVVLMSLLAVSLFSACKCNQASCDTTEAADTTVVTEAVVTDSAAVVVTDTIVAQ